MGWLTLYICFKEYTDFINVMMCRIFKLIPISDFISPTLQSSFLLEVFDSTLSLPLSPSAIFYTYSLHYEQFIYFFGLSTSARYSRLNRSTRKRTSKEMPADLSQN